MASLGLVPKIQMKNQYYSNFTEKLRTIGRSSSSSRKPGVSSLIMGSALKAERLRSNNRTFIIFVMTNTTTDTFRLRLFYTQRGKRQKHTLHHRAAESLRGLIYRFTMNLQSSVKFKNYQRFACLQTCLRSKVVNQSICEG